MIVRFSDRLRKAIFRSSMTSKENTASDIPEEILERIPQWLSEMAIVGTIGFMEPKDYRSLDPEIIQYLEILSP